MKKFICFLLSALMVFPLSACGKKAAASAQPSAPAPAVVTKTPSVAVTPKKEDLTLYIGISGGIKEVPCTVERTPEALIAALAEETGWSLPIKNITVDQPKSGCLTIVFAADSSLYIDPPEKQKDAYHVFEITDWVYTVLNSVSKTLDQNLDIDGVAFASPDGGDVDAGNQFVKFHFDNETLWDYERADHIFDPEDDPDPITLLIEMMDTRGETSSVIMEDGEEIIGGEHCTVFSIGENSPDGDKFNAMYHYAVGDTGKIWTIDVMQGPEWILLNP